MGNDVETLKQYTIEIDVKTDNVTKKIDDLKKEVNKGIDASKLSKNLQDQFDRVEKQVNSMSGTIKKEVGLIKTQLDNGFKGISTDELQGKLKAVDESILAITDKIDLLSQTLTNSDFAKFERFVDAFTIPLSEMKDVVVDLTTTLQGLTEPLQTISKMKIGAIDSTAFSKSMEALEDEVDKSKVRIEDIALKIKDILNNELSGNSLSGVIDSLKLDKSSVDRVEKETAKQLVIVIDSLFDEIKRENERLSSIGTSVNIADILSTELGVSEKLLKEYRKKLIARVEEDATEKTTAKVQIEANANLSDEELEKQAENVTDQIQTKLIKKIEDNLSKNSTKVKIPLKADTAGFKDNELKPAIEQLNNELKNDDALKVDVIVKPIIDKAELKSIQGNLQDEIEKNGGLTASTTNNFDIKDLGGIATEETLSGIAQNVASLVNGVKIVNGKPVVTANSQGGTTPNQNDPNAKSETPKLTTREKNFDWLLRHKTTSEFRSRFDTRAQDAATKEIEKETEDLYDELIKSVRSFFLSTKNKINPQDKLNSSKILEEIGDGYAKYGNGLKVDEFKNNLSSTIDGLVNLIQSQIDKSNTKFEKMKNSSLTKDTKDTVVGELEKQLHEATVASKLKQYVTKKESEVTEYIKSQNQNDFQRLSDLNSIINKNTTSDVDKNKFEELRKKYVSELDEFRKLNLYIKNNSGKAEKNNDIKQKVEDARKRIEELLKISDIKDITSFDAKVSAKNDATLEKSRILQNYAKEIISNKFKDSIKEVTNSTELTDSIKGFIDAAAKRAIKDIVGQYTSGKVDNVKDIEKNLDTKSNTLSTKRKELEQLNEDLITATDEDKRIIGEKIHLLIIDIESLDEEVKVIEEELDVARQNLQGSELVTAKKNAHTRYKAAENRLNNSKDAVIGKTVGEQFGNGVSDSSIKNFERRLENMSKMDWGSLEKILLGRNIDEVTSIKIKDAITEKFKTVQTGAINETQAKDIIYNLFKEIDAQTTEKNKVRDNIIGELNEEKTILEQIKALREEESQTGVNNEEKINQLISNEVIQLGYKADALKRQNVDIVEIQSELNGLFGQRNDILTGTKRNNVTGKIETFEKDREKELTDEEKQRLNVIERQIALLQQRKDIVESELNKSLSYDILDEFNIDDRLAEIDKLIKDTEKAKSAAINYSNNNKRILAGSVFSEIKNRDQYDEKKEDYLKYLSEYRELAKTKNKTPYEQERYDTLKNRLKSLREELTIFAQIEGIEEKILGIENNQSEAIKTSLDLKNKKKK